MEVISGTRSRVTWNTCLITMIKLQGIGLLSRRHTSSSTMRYPTEANNGDNFFLVQINYQLPLAAPHLHPVTRPWSCFSNDSTWRSLPRFSDILKSIWWNSFEDRGCRCYLPAWPGWWVLSSAASQTPERYQILLWALRYQILTRRSYP